MLGTEMTFMTAVRHLQLLSIMPWKINPSTEGLNHCSALNVNRDVADTISVPPTQCAAVGYHFVEAAIPSVATLSFPANTEWPGMADVFVLEYLSRSSQMRSPGLVAHSYILYRVVCVVGRA